MHPSTLNDYLARLTDEDKAKDEKMTLGALSVELNWQLEKSFETVLPTDTLSFVQDRMNLIKECCDVFVTADGTKSKPAERWITNDDIIKIVRA